MNAYKLIKEDIQSFIITWLKTGLVCNPQTGGDFFSNQTEIKSKGMFYKTRSEYINNFFQNYEKGQYFLALSDGSVFQVAFTFCVNKRHSYLIKARMSYDPCVSNGDLSHNYIRLDYDTTIDNSFFHPMVHLHVGFDGDIRIPINDIPLFSEFFKFIMYLYYPDDYKQLVHQKDIGNNHSKENGRLTQIFPISNELKEFIYMDISNLCKN